ncbi:hypothetical protein [Paenibacillus lutrae]|nr:hypothetical protein [Paenibacillus lutrae]
MKSVDQRTILIFVREQESVIALLESKAHLISIVIGSASARNISL